MTASSSTLPAARPRERRIVTVVSAVPASTYSPVRAAGAAPSAVVQVSDVARPPADAVAETTRYVKWRPRPKQNEAPVVAAAPTSERAVIEAVEPAPASATRPALSVERPRVVVPARVAPKAAPRPAPRAATAKAPASPTDEDLFRAAVVHLVLVRGVERARASLDELVRELVDGD